MRLTSRGRCLSDIIEESGSNDVSCSTKVVTNYQTECFGTFNSGVHLPNVLKGEIGILNGSSDDHFADSGQKSVGFGHDWLSGVDFRWERRSGSSIDVRDNPFGLVDDLKDRIPFALDGGIELG